MSQAERRRARPRKRGAPPAPGAAARALGAAPGAAGRAVPWSTATRRGGVCA